MVRFRCVPFYDLTLDELYAMLRLRSEVFVVEQTCVYQDVDNKDQRSFHLLAFDQENDLIGYTRLVPKGTSYEEYPSIGRVLTSEKVRRNGSGKILMKKSIEEIQRLFGEKKIKISAQCYLDKFYKDLGFSPIGEEYLEDDIPHIAMVWESEN